MSTAFKKFPSGHEAIRSWWRHSDPNFKWRRYPWFPWRRLVIFTARLSQRVCRQYIVLSLHPKLRGMSVTRIPASRRANAGFLSFVDSLDGDLSLLTLNFLRMVAIGTTLFEYRTANEKITLPVYRSMCTSCILKFGWYSLIEALFVTQ